MEHKFKLGKTIYLVIVFVLLIGILLGLMNSTYVLKFLPNGSIMSGNEDHLKVTRLSKQTLSSFKKEEYLLIYNKDNPYSVDIKDNFSHTLSYMKKKVTIVSLSDVPSSFKPFQNVIIAFEEVSKLPNLGALESYTANGGKVLFAIRPEIQGSLQNLYRKLGIYEIGEFVNPNGLKLTTNVLIRQKQFTLKKEEMAQNSSLSVGLDPHCTIYIKSLDRIPLLWDIPYKNGKFMVFNGSLLGSKENRGLITGSLSLLNENYIYPIMNMKVAYIDDFPAPLPGGINRKIYDEYHRNTSSFFKDIWWPDMLKSAERYDMKYTGVVIESYSDKVKPPFNENEQVENTFVRFGRELLKMGGEIGIHGYNHQSLTINPKAVNDLGYNVWKNQTDMETSLMETKKYLKELFPNYQIGTYVPPSNRIDSVGMTAVHNSIPSIKVLSSLYLPDSTKYSTVQEFEKGDQFILFPRITSGYEYTNKKNWAMANAITSIGVFSHFIHPDDILDNERSSDKKWSVLYKEYDHILQELHSDYPWLKGTTASKAGNQLSNYLDADVYIKEEKNRMIIMIDKFPGEMDFILRTKKKIGALKNCKVQKVDDNVYIVKANKASIELGLVD